MHRYDARSGASASRSALANNSVNRSGRGRPVNDRDRLAPAPAPDINAKFNFARLPYLDIVNEISSILQRKVTVEELKDPTPEFVREVLWKFVDEILHKPRDQLLPLAMGVVDQMPNPELHDEAATADLLLLRYGQQMMDMSGFRDFSIRDIFSPDKARFHFQISALLNFARFRWMRAQAFEEKMAKCDEEIARHKALREENARLEQVIANIEAEGEAEMPELERLKQESNELSLTLQAQHRQQQELMDKTNEFKERLKKAAEKGEALRERVAAERKELQWMESRVVASPARVRRELEDMRRKLEEKRRYRDELAKRVELAKKREATLVKLAEDAEKIAHLTHDTAEKLKELHHTMSMTDRLRAQKAEVMAENRSLDEMKQRVQRDIASLDARGTRMDEQMKGIANRESDVEKKHEESMKAKRNKIDEVKKLRMEKAAVNSKLTQDILKDAEDFEKQFAVLEKKVDAYCDARRKIDDNFNESLSIMTEVEGKRLEEMVKWLGKNEYARRA